MSISLALGQLIDAIERRVLAHGHPETLDDELHDREVAEAGQALENSLLALVDERLSKHIH